MKKLAVVLVIATAVMLVGGGLAMAENGGKIFTQTVEGRNDDCPFLNTFYLGKTFKEVPFISKVGDPRVEIGYTSNIRAITKDNMVYTKVGIEL